MSVTPSTVQPRPAFKQTHLRYPLLEPLLQELGLELRGRYTTKQVATIFGVSARTVEKLMAAGKLQRRNLPGHAKCLSCDLEDYLRDSHAQRQVAQGPCSSGTGGPE